MPAKPIERLARALCAITDDGKPAKVVELARAWGVDGRLARRAARGIPVNVSVYLQLCAAAGIDPVTGEPVIVDGPLPALDPNRLAIKVLLALIAGQSLRKLAKAWRVEYTAINRAKHGLPVNVENFLKICAGLGVHPHSVLTFHAKQSLQQSDEERAST